MPHYKSCKLTDAVQSDSAIICSATLVSTDTDGHMFESKGAGGLSEQLPSLKMIQMVQKSRLMSTRRELSGRVLM